MKKAVDLDRNNPYYMSYLGVVLARSEQKWGEAERLCDTAVRMKRNQAQLYLNLAEVYATAGRREEAVEALQSGLKFARRDVRLTIAMNRLAERRPPVLTFLTRQNPHQPAAGNHAAQDSADVRTRLISSFLQPQSKKRRMAKRHPLFLFPKI